MDLEEMKERLEFLLAANPETGKQWAAICLLEQLIADAEQNAAERAYERQCDRFYGGDSPSVREQQAAAMRLK